MKWLVLAGLLVAVRAEAQTVDDHLAKVRELYDKGDFVHARDELLAAYHVEARPELLFALGQVELNLGHYDKAITYYEQFIATEPHADQVALAQQAIGAARARLAEKPAPAPDPPPSPRRAWDTEDSALAVLGGTMLALGGGVFAYGYHHAGDHRGTLSAYEQRVSRGTLLQWIGAGSAAAGALSLGGALLRWRLHVVNAELQPLAAPRTAGLLWVGRW
jgi:tetratricopeptide (TPR) repeat protein